VAGNEGIIWILAVLYFISALLTKFITLPDNAKTLHHVKEENAGVPELKLEN
jgi:hypothetical protein